MGHIDAKQKMIVPLVAFVVIACLIALIIYPVVSASPKGIKLAVLSLDEGAQTPQGEMNLGDTMVESITAATDESAAAAGGGGEAPVTWTVLSNEAELNAAMDANEYYAALVIPADFTTAKIAAQMNANAAVQPNSATATTTTPATTPQTTTTTVTEPTNPTLTINQGKNPTIAANIETMFMAMLGDSGVTVDVEYINPVPAELGSGAIAQQMLYMLTIIVSVILSIVLFIAIRPQAGAPKKARIRAVIIQLIYAVILSLGVGWFVSFFMTTLAGFAVPFAQTMLFAWIASFALMALFLGFLNLHPALGALAIITVIGCGLTTALLPYETLPAFWQNWLYPWVPERFIADGLGQILYLDGDVINSSTTVLLWIIAGGAVLMLLSLLKPAAKDGEDVRENDGDVVPEAVASPAPASGSETKLDDNSLPSPQ